jgi:hypothetical protein
MIKILFLHRVKPKKIENNGLDYQYSKNTEYLCIKPFIGDNILENQKIPLSP